jgi:acetyltransferase-like isoleucine patch superfamily enzyme
MKKGSQINSGTRIVGNSTFKMGEFATVGYNTVILTSTDIGKIMNDYTPFEDREIIKGAVILGDEVFVGSGVVICVSKANPLINIGNNTIIMVNNYVDKCIVPNVKYGRWG